MQEDEERGNGLGCAGGGDPEPREHASGLALPRYLVDRAHPSNAEVKYGVGTVFLHSAFGWTGVIVGWDSECRMCDHWMQQRGVVSLVADGYDEDESVADLLRIPHTHAHQDNLPEGGRHQPFYQIINESNGEAYVPQCQITQIGVPAGSTPDEAVAILQDLVPLMQIRTLGKAFRTLRVAPWDAPKEQGEQGETKLISKSKAKKEEKRAKKLEKNKTADEAAAEPRGPAKGQIHLVTNAWMREAWPYD